MPDQAQLDEFARQHGFHDYATMAAYQQHKSQALRQRNYMVGPGTEGNVAPPPPAQPAVQESAFQKLMRMWGGAVK